MKNKKKKTDEKTKLNKAQEILYGRDFKRADRAGGFK